MTDLEYAKALRCCAAADRGQDCCDECPRVAYCVARLKVDRTYKPVTSLFLEVAERIERTWGKEN